MSENTIMEHRSIFNRQTLLSEADVRQRIRRVRNYSLLLGVGALFGLCIPLSKFTVQIDEHPVGLTIWVNVIVASLCLGVCVARRRMPLMNWQVMRFILLWAFFGSALGEVLLFWIASTLPATTLSIIVVCEGFFVYAIVACRSKTISVRSLAGLSMGLSGVVLMMASQGSITFSGHLYWILAALIIPLVYAVEDLLLADAMPSGLDIVAGTGLSALAAVLMLLPVAWLLGDLVTLDKPGSPLTLSLLCLGLISTVGTVLMARLLKQSGPVFGSLAGYTITAFGILWAVLLLDETIGYWSLAALLLLVAGLALVEPRKRKRRRDALPRTYLYP